MLTPLRTVASLCLALGLVACGSGDRPGSSDTMGGHNAVPTAPRPSADVPATDDVATGSCQSGASRDCRLWLPEVNGVKNCFVGTQVCADDEWSDCLSDDDAAALLDD